MLLLRTQFEDTLKVHSGEKLNRQCDFACSEATSSFDTEESGCDNGRTVLRQFANAQVCNRLRGGSSVRGEEVT